MNVLVIECPGFWIVQSIRSKIKYCVARTHVSGTRLQKVIYRDHLPCLAVRCWRWSRRMLQQRLIPRPPTRSQAAAAVVDLSGDWRLRLDPRGSRTRRQLAGARRTDDRITLPNPTVARVRFRVGHTHDVACGTVPTDDAVPWRKGGRKSADAHGYLVRRYRFVGRPGTSEVEIPAMWKDCPVTLRIERAMWKTNVWVDGRPAGSCTAWSPSIDMNLASWHLGAIG